MSVNILILGMLQKSLKIPTRIRAGEPLHKHVETILAPKNTSNLKSQDTKSIGWELLQWSNFLKVTQEISDQTRNKTCTSHASAVLYFSLVERSQCWSLLVSSKANSTGCHHNEGRERGYIHFNSLPKLTEPLHGMQLSTKPSHFSSLFRICKPDGSLCITWLNVL